MPELNQVQEEGLFDDFTETDSEVEDNTEIEDTAEEAEETVEETVDEPFLNIKYNKEDVALTRDEAIELAQKGKNYDKVNEKFNAVNSKLERLAKANGKNVDEYLIALDEAQLNYEISKEMKNLKSQYPNANEEMLRELAERRVDSNNELRLKEETKIKSEESDAQLEEIKRQVSRFQNKLPNLKPDGLEQDVYDLMKEGYTVLESYLLYKDSKEESERPAKETKEKIARLNESNKSKSLGNTSNVDSIMIDDFLSGFDS